MTSGMIVTPGTIVTPATPDGHHASSEMGKQPVPGGSCIKAVMFDFGGVLYRMPNAQRTTRMLRFFGVRNPGPIMMAIASPLESQLVMDLMTGRLNEQVVWERLAQELGVRPALLRFFRQRGLSPRRVDPTLVAYLEKLRPRYRTAILTNAGSDFRATFARAYALEKLVDQLIISAEEGFAKPDERLYHLALERLGVSPEETVFIDDIPENVESARKAGIAAFVHQDTTRTIAWLDEVLK